MNKCWLFLFFLTILHRYEIWKEIARDSDRLDLTSWFTRCQMHELCLRGYNLVILDRAFLVHAPGIKRRSKTKAKDSAWRDPFVAKNSRIYDKIMEEMQNKFGPSDVCHRHWENEMHKHALDILGLAEFWETILRCYCLASSFIYAVFWCHFNETPRLSCDGAFLWRHLAPAMKEWLNEAILCCPGQRWAPSLTAVKRHECVVYTE